MNFSDLDPFTCAVLPNLSILNIFQCASNIYGIYLGNNICYTFFIHKNLLSQEQAKFVWFIKWNWILSKWSMNYTNFALRKGISLLCNSFIFWFPFCFTFLSFNKNILFRISLYLTFFEFGILICLNYFNQWLIKYFKQISYLTYFKLFLCLFYFCNCFFNRNLFL